MLQKLTDHLNKLGKRKRSFEIMVEHAFKIHSPFILETGCARQENNYEGDGLSTIIWDTLTDLTGGDYVSVDISPESVKFAKMQVNNPDKIICQDSVEFINSDFLCYDRSIDILYLDSYDLDINNPHPSAMHHMFELLSAQKYLRGGSLICVDDNLNLEAAKGKYIRQYFDMIGKQPIYDGYQIIWEY